MLFRPRLTTSSFITMVDISPLVGFSFLNLQNYVKGVFDGHGGDEASKFVNSHLHFNIVHELENSDVSIDDALREAVLKTDDQFCSRATTMRSTAGVCVSPSFYTRYCLSLTLCCFP